MCNVFTVFPTDIFLMKKQREGKKGFNPHPTLGHSSVLSEETGVLGCPESEGYPSTSLGSPEPQSPHVRRGQQAEYVAALSPPTASR
jgi:hypothetical protein